MNHPNNPQEFLSAGWDGAIHVWDARCTIRGQEIGDIQGIQEAQEFQEDPNRQIILGCCSGDLIV